MQNKPSLVINTSPLVALVAGLDDFRVLAEVATLIVPGEVLTERGRAAPVSNLDGTIRPRRSVLPLGHMRSRHACSWLPFTAMAVWVE